jgi:hypothetical protein
LHEKYELIKKKEDNCIRLKIVINNYIKISITQTNINNVVISSSFPNEHQIPRLEKQKQSQLLHFFFFFLI